jgi:hypothetical protein
MNLIKSMILTVAALSCTTVFAQDGSELASQAAQKMRVAQEARFYDQEGKSSTEYVRSDAKAPVEQMKKSEG